MTDTRPPYTLHTADRAASIRLPYGVATYVDEVGLALTDTGDVEITLLVDLDTSDPDASPDGGFASLTIPRTAFDALVDAIRAR